MYNVERFGGLEGVVREDRGNRRGRIIRGWMTSGEKR